METQENSSLRSVLLTQLDTAWALTQYHLNGLTTQECLLRPARKGLHVEQGTDGVWRAEWPESEGYDIGPASIAWLTWHMGFWWSMVHDHSFGTGALKREDVHWPGTAEGVQAWITRLHDQWRSAVMGLDDSELDASTRTRWPLEGRPFADIVAWVNVELMKNAAELGYARFVLAVADR
ncbi:DinB family protein [Corallococcus sp. AB030]|uniref:DinB family protein n=1 Tax=Corallococcus TaxID=83461 RepID=UPI000EA20E65|nr:MULTISPECIES: DinB family protein [unclassified Corallococcus]RKH23236.1 DinB family protein [Corallococcus sp. CA041A]RKI20575.1 DinB family protein [Corallococcus sp. AB030]